MAKIKEADLLKALNELEETVEKGGDPLQNQDPEGGLSTEGTPLSDKVKEGKSAVSKTMSASDTGSGDDESSGKKGKTKKSEDDDVEKGGKKKKAMPPPDDGSDDEGSDDGSSDDASDNDSDDTSKSMTLRRRAENDDEMQKAIEVSEFLESLVDRTSETISDVSEMLSERIEKSEAVQRDFNRRLAKAVVTLGKTVNEQNEMLKSLLNQPNVPQRRSVLNKSDVVEPPMGGGSQSGLRSVPKAQVEQWLTDKCIKGEIDLMSITIYEQNNYNPEVLPPQIRKALEADLVK